MPQGLLIRLQPTTPWRIGPASGDRDRVDRVYHSDAMYSAVSSAMQRLGMLDEWLDATARAAEPAVRFSSCFPFWSRTLYVVPPRSIWPPAATPKVRWKGARFVPLSVVETLLKGQNISEESWSVDGASETLVPQGAPALFRVSVRTSAAVDRQGISVAPHSSACIEFAPGAGLWLFARFSNEAARQAWKGPVSAALRLLADSGFGGERSQGWGRADIEIADHDTQLLGSNHAGGESGWWLLSLFHPSESDAVDWRKGNYAITTRSGRIESTARWGEAKRASRMITEGSVIVASEEPRGSATDVAPESFPHPVYRAGYALSIRIPVGQAFSLQPGFSPALVSPPPEVPAVDDETPVGETPGAETPSAETPSAETPSAETPSAETPSAETPSAETPGAETPSAETPNAEALSTETPTDDMSSEEPAESRLQAESLPYSEEEE